MSTRQEIGTRDGVPTCPFDHQAAPGIGDELYDVYRDLRGHGPVWSDRHGGFWMVTAYDHARAVLKDHGTFSSAQGCFLPDSGYRNLALEQDPPEAAPFRAVFQSAVGRPAVTRYEPQIAAMVRRRVGDFVVAGGGDARAAISETVPVEAICLVLGLPDEVAVRVRRMTTDAWRVMYTDPAALVPISEMLLAEVADRATNPRDDFLTSLTTTEVDGRRLTEEQIGNILVGAVIAGHETTMNASSNLMYELARDPELQQRLRDDRSAVPRVVEESLRHRAPIHMFFRTVTQAVELGGVSMRPGDKVALVYAAANRDPERFDAPDAFTADRDDIAHLSFGWGVHRCVGSFLAQTELRHVVNALLDAGTLSVDEVEMAPLTGGAHMGMSRLVLSVGRVHD